ncbi:WXG100 family type VII secretion target [Nocardia africana]|uniref:WXG100 family type VII secretion target n=1 Tax=Nocardia africana TaxID=134964 RepID=A0A378WQQ5_9NOCA|nr:WXG100 family type VII secretion target [Nocardia africana]MCC3314774.1 WXG100 family type VII secretion target [Nocardia africana]SUA42945.1 WXG100 family type VII secretion target [Nocardia africana]
MPASYRVDLDGMQRLIDATAKLEAALETKAEEIARRIDELHVDWTGDAAKAHREAHDARIAAAAEMQGALKALRQKLAAARTAYHGVGPANTGMWPQ